MSSRSGRESGGKSAGVIVLLERCLAIQLQKVTKPPSVCEDKISQKSSPRKKEKATSKLSPKRKESSPSKSSPKHQKCPKSVSKLTPKQTPKNTPKITPKQTPKSTPKSSPKSQKSLLTCISDLNDADADVDDSASSGSLTPTQPSTDWMYESGYLVFQGLQEANLKCFWNQSLLEAITAVQYQGYVSPGTLLLTASQSHLEVIRGAWARKVLMSPSDYVISLVGDIEGCIVQPIPQGQFTPLPEALCWVIFNLGSAGNPANLDTISAALHTTFLDMEKPGENVIYDTLGKLIRERKIYHTSGGYFIVTPDTYNRTTQVMDADRPLLMSNDEAIALVHGQTETYPDGHLTHVAIQTNLADVICGGNPTDKVLYAREDDPAGSPRPRLERHHSLRLFGNKRLAADVMKGGSLRLSPSKSRELAVEISKLSHVSSDTEISGGSKKKVSVFSRLFRRGSSKKRPNITTFSAQFPPTEWSEPGVTVLHSVGTQTKPPKSRHNSSNASPKIKGSVDQQEGSHSQSSLRWEDEVTSRSATLPRRMPSRADRSPHLDSTRKSSQSLNRNSALNKSPTRSSNQVPNKNSSAQSSRRNSQSNYSPHKVASDMNQSPSRNSKNVNQSPSRNSKNVHQSPSKNSKNVHQSPSKNSKNANQSPSKNSSNSQSPSNDSCINQSPSKNSCISQSPVRNTKVQQSPKKKRERSVSGRSSDNHVSSHSMEMQVIGNSLTDQASGHSSENHTSGHSLESHVTTTDLSSSSPNTSGEWTNKNTSYKISRMKRPISLYKTEMSTEKEPKEDLSMEEVTQGKDPQGHAKKDIKNVYKPKTVKDDVGTSCLNATVKNGVGNGYLHKSMKSATENGYPHKSSISANENDYPHKSSRSANENGYPHKSLKSANENGYPHKAVKSANESENCHKLTKSDMENGYPDKAVKNDGENSHSSTPKQSDVGRSFSPTSIKSDVEISYYPKIVKCDMESVFPLAETKHNNVDIGEKFGISPSFLTHSFSGFPMGVPIKLTNSEKFLSDEKIEKLISPPEQHPMNNSRKIIISPGTKSENLNYKNVFNEDNSPIRDKSPTKSFSTSGLCYSNIEKYGKPQNEEKTVLLPSKKTISPSTPDDKASVGTYPSLTDLNINFTSITGQRILRGISVASIDTLVEVNMLAEQKQKNCDLSVRTDFGVV